jgi:chorismate dehydratase
MRPRLAIPDHLFVQPLVYGLDRPHSPFEIVTDLPAKNSLAFSQRTGNIRCAFLSPIDYARHGAEYCIVPGLGTSAGTPNGVIRLLVRPDARAISTVAVDIRVTSEIILAKIIIQERYRNADGSERDLTFIPMLPDPEAMLKKADAALVVEFGPNKLRVDSGVFELDLVEEWTDMTGLPYVFGFWVGREEELAPEEAKALIDAGKTGMSVRERLVADLAAARQISRSETESYFASFSYELGEREEQSLEEFIRYAYYLGALPDAPELTYFDLDTPPASPN